MFTAAVVDRLNWSPGRIAAFGAVALVASRAWLPLLTEPWPDVDLLYEYPIQRLFMLTGWPTTESYLLLAGCGSAVAVAVWLLAARGGAMRLAVRRVPARGSEGRP